jgi:hypothetical protein
MNASHAGEALDVAKLMFGTGHITALLGPGVVRPKARARAKLDVDARASELRDSSNFWIHKSA